MSLFIFRCIEKLYTTACTFKVWTDFLFIHHHHYVLQNSLDQIARIPQTFQSASISIIAQRIKTKSITFSLSFVSILPFSFFFFLILNLSWFCYVSLFIAFLTFIFTLYLTGLICATLRFWRVQQHPRGFAK